MKNMFTDFSQGCCGNAFYIFRQYFELFAAHYWAIFIDANIHTINHILFYLSQCLKKLQKIGHTG